MKTAILIVLFLMCASVPAAALLDMGGQKIVVLTADEFIAAMRDKDAEIERLKSERKKGCGLI